VFSGSTLRAASTTKLGGQEGSGVYDGVAKIVFSKHRIDAILRVRRCMGTGNVLWVTLGMIPLRRKRD
jgi:hypothetical protein